MTPVINNSMSNNDTVISRKRKVHFSNAVDITEIHTHRDYTTQERTSIWYTGDEYSKFKRLKKIWMLLDDDVDVDVDDDGNDSKILHVAVEQEQDNNNKQFHHHHHHHNHRKRRKCSNRELIIRAQEMERTYIHDSKKRSSFWIRLAELYHKKATCSVILAHHRALRNRNDIQKSLLLCNSSRSSSSSMSSSSSSSSMSTTILTKRLPLSTSNFMAQFEYDNVNNALPTTDSMMMMVSVPNPLRQQCFLE